MANPQSWNRYACVLNNPASSFDLFGLGGDGCTWDPITNTLNCPGPPPLPIDGGGPGPAGCRNPEDPDPRCDQGTGPPRSTGGGGGPQNTVANGQLVDALNALNNACRNNMRAILSQLYLSALQVTFLDASKTTPRTGVNPGDIYTPNLFRIDATSGLPRNVFWSDVAPNGPQTPIAYPPGGRAAAATLGNTVVLYPAFWGLSQQQQQAGLVHEDLHVVTGYSDIQLANYLTGQTVPDFQTAEIAISQALLQCF